MARDAGKTVFITENSRTVLQSLQFKVQADTGKRVTYSQMITAMCALADNNYNALIDILSKEIN
jgi:hypothetical protein